MKTFYNNTESSVLHNGYTTNYFKLSRGVRQGCPLSPYLFNISGLKLNLGKTKAIWLGSWRHKESKPLGLNWTNEPVRALGIFISYNKQENDKKNVAKKIDNLNIKLDLWRGCKLSLFGKCLIVKALGISQIVYSASMLDISPNDTSTIKKSIFSFIWNKKLL